MKAKTVEENLCNMKENGIDKLNGEMWKSMAEEARQRNETMANEGSEAMKNIWILKKYQITGRKGKTMEEASKVTE